MTTDERPASVLGADAPEPATIVGDGAASCEVCGLQPWEGHAPDCKVAVTAEPPRFMADIPDWPTPAFWGACGVPECDECWPLFDAGNEPITDDFGRPL